ncbi:MAG: DUF2748 family protein [Alphaproteobacteria bacterium]|nr:DUF2748 family protein [Alphaproteobacteria bacterium]
MVSIYHLTDKDPILEGDELYPELELLAQAIVKSGRLRIDANPASNCIKLTIPELYITLAFSVREINDAALIKRTQKFIYNLWFRKFGNKDRALAKTQQTIVLLKKEIDKLVPLDPSIEIKIARILAQTIHPVVLQLILIDGVEFFVTYGHSIGEMLDIPTWKSSGDNSGMQSTDGIDSAIFISCGGDPLGETDKENPTFGDGKPALARMMIIGAQEMGHFSDIKRDNIGRQIGRYSAFAFGSRPDPKVSEMRRRDIQHVKDLERKLKIIGLDKLLEAEKNYKFFIKVKKGWITIFFFCLIYQFRRMKFCLKASTVKLNVIDKFMVKHKFAAHLIDTMISDMLFNLEPKADVYSRSNKQEEEAIACVEALARVPQQVIKWGKNETRLFTPNLYKYYYSEVIPGCIRAFETLANRKYRNKITLPRFYYLKKFKNYIKKLLSKKRIKL